MNLEQLIDTLERIRDQAHASPLTPVYLAFGGDAAALVPITIVQTCYDMNAKPRGWIVLHNHPPQAGPVGQ